MIKFKGKAFQEVKSVLSGRIIFKFDSKGEFFTDDENIIERAKPFFNYEEIQNSNKAENKAEKTENKAEKVNKCKYCGKEFADFGELMAHYKKRKDDKCDT